MANEIVVKPVSIIQSLGDVERAATAMLKSGFFSDVTDLAKATVKILAGQEIGIGAFASMTGIHIIKGKPTYGANIIAAKIKASGKYDYRVDEMTEQVCKITFLQGDKEIGQSVFTIADAKKAGTQNTEKFPRNMLFARAISNGYRWFCPDVTFVTMYTPEEFGADVDDSGNVVIEAVATMSQVMTLEQAEKITTQKGTLLTALTVEQLSIVVIETHDETIREAAKIILGNKEGK